MIQITDKKVRTTMRQTIINDKRIHNNSLIYKWSINIKIIIIIFLIIVILKLRTSEE
jgi:hypothetical protein